VTGENRLKQVRRLFTPWFLPCTKDIHSLLATSGSKPHSLQQQLHPWLAPPPGAPRLRELLLHGHARPAVARLSDGSTAELPARASLPEALAALRAARAALTTAERAAALLPASQAGSASNGEAGQHGSDGGGGFVPAAAAGSERDASMMGSTTSSDGEPWQPWVGGGEDYSGAPLFDADNRMALPGTLHRISAARARDGRRVVGLTYRVGRHVPGAAAPLYDVLAQMAAVHRGRAPGACFGGAAAAPKGGGAAAARLLGGGDGMLGQSPSLLLLGRPGAGKTTVGATALALHCTANSRACPRAHMGMLPALPCIAQACREVHVCAASKSAANPHPTIGFGSRGHCANSRCPNHPQTTQLHSCCGMCQGSLQMIWG
jgi:hypothetical protein